MIKKDRISVGDKIKSIVQAPIMIKDKLPLADSVKQLGVPFKGVLYEKLIDEFGRPMLRKVSDNTVVLGGAITTLESLTGSTATFRPKTINEILEINQENKAQQAATIGVPTIALFGLGIGGATLDFGSINAKDIKSNNIPTMIPLRVCEELTGPDKEKYFMKKLRDDGTTYEYYLKEFADSITVKSLWKDSAESDDDGTEIIQEVAELDRSDGIESFAEMKVSLNVNDAREYFEDIGETDMARYNTLGIYTGNKVTLPNGETDYINVRLFAYTNFNNRDLSLKTEASYLYRIYALV